MGVPRFENLSGTVDGVNRTFFAPSAYAAGTASVFLNGQLMKYSGGDPWTETDPSTGEIELAVDCTPILTDELQIFYIDTSTPPDQTEICEIRGDIDSISDLSCALTAADELQGTLDQVDVVYSNIDAIRPTEGYIDSQDDIYGEICECP